jgi:hypothetical protein
VGVWYVGKKLLNNSIVGVWYVVKNLPNNSIMPVQSGMMQLKYFERTRIGRV